MTLKEKLERLQKLEKEKTEKDWVLYKEGWRESVSVLQTRIWHEWLREYEDRGLMEFASIPVKRIDSYFGEYSTFILEITLSGNKYLVLDPISSVTADSDGRMDFYLRGSMDKKVTFLRMIHENGKEEWVVAPSTNPDERYALNKAVIEKIIDQWLQ
ncbi:MAG: hypothetical protein H6581_13020 [Bacteroidia bacterium]|nr:hypothetical protein [Bacteroidia bacterium]